MKLTSSPSVSSSTFTGIFPASKGSVFGCLSFVFKRILCSRSLPTHPFDQFKEITDPHENPKTDAPTTPNLVARLMGLDSIPESNSEKDYSPSKSLNPADCESEETGEKQGQHRRTKTSVSFRETPSYFELEDGDFFVLSFENGKRSRNSRVRRAKSEMGGRKDEQMRRRRVQIRERPSLKVSERDNFVVEMGNSDGEINGRSRKKKKEKCLVEAKVESESDESENLSPVSVLDHSLFNGDHEEVATTSEEESRRSRSSSPRRTLASELSKLEHHSSDDNNEACSKGDHDQEQNEEIEVDQAGLQRKDYHSQQNIEMLDQICRMAESEMSNSEWECKNKVVIRNLNKWEVEIGAELSLQIVEQLVYEVVRQLL